MAQATGLHGAEPSGARLYAMYQMAQPMTGGQISEQADSVRAGFACFRKEDPGIAGGFPAYAVPSRGF